MKKDRSKVPPTSLEYILFSFLMMEMLNPPNKKTELMEELYDQVVEYSDDVSSKLI